MDDEPYEPDTRDHDPDAEPVYSEQERRERHALYTGAVFGLAIKYALPFDPVMDERGNYTDRMRLMVNHRGTTIEVDLIVPEPPDTWTLTSWTSEGNPMADVLTKLQPWQRRIAERVERGEVMRLDDRGRMVWVMPEPGDYGPPT